MARYDIGFGGRWQERFDDLETATARAEELAAEGRVVEVAKAFLGLHSFVTAFPESEREMLKARRGYPYVGDIWGFGVNAEGDHHDQGGAPGGHVVGGHSHGGSFGGHDGGSHGGGGTHGH